MGAMIAYTISKHQLGDIAKVDQKMTETEILVGDEGFDTSLNPVVIHPFHVLINSS